MALVRVGRKAAIDLDRVRAIRVEGDAATAFFAGGCESVTFSNAEGEWSGLIDSLPPVGATAYPNDAQGSADPPAVGGDLPSAGIG